jgi:hypothetical protein
MVIAGIPQHPIGFGRGICGGQSGNGAGFIRVLLFPLPSILSTNCPAIIISIIIIVVVVV